MSNHATINKSIKNVVKRSDLKIIKLNHITINDTYKEYVVDVKLPKEVFNDREFSQLIEIKMFRKLIKETFNEKNVRGKTISGMVVLGSDDKNFGRLVFQLKTTEK